MAKMRMPCPLELFTLAIMFSEMEVIIPSYLKYLLFLYMILSYHF